MAGGAGGVPGGGYGVPGAVPGLVPGAGAVPGAGGRQKVQTSHTGSILKLSHHHTQAV